MARVQLREAGRGELAQDDLEDRVLVADGDQRLGQRGGVRAQPDALAAGQDDCVHGSGSSHGLTVAGGQML